MILELTTLSILIALFGGLTLSIGLFKKLFNWFEIIIMGIILGILLPNITYAVLLLLNINFSLTLWLAIIGVYCVIGLILIFLKTSLSDLKNLISSIHMDKELIKRNIPYIALLAVFVISFYIGIQTFPYNYYEFDPFMYMTNAQVILWTGQIQAHPYLAYSVYQNITSNRFEPIVPYWMAGLQSIGGKLFNSTLQQTAEIYPPLIFVLFGGLVFILFDRAFKDRIGHLSKYLGFITASLMLSMSVLVQQFVGALFQEEAFGFFSVIALITTLYIANKENKWEYSLLAGIFYVGVLLGSKYFTVISVVMPIFLMLYALILFLKRESMIPLIKTNGLISLFVLFGNIYLLLYGGGFGLSGFSLHGIFIPINLVLIAVAMVFALLLELINYLTAKQILKLDLMTNKGKAIAITLVMVILFIIGLPILSKAISYANYLLQFSSYQGEPLFKTVQEFSNSPVNDLTPYFGIFGSPLVYWGIIALFGLMIAYKAYKKDLDLLALILIPTVFPLFYTSLSLSKYLSDGAIVIILAIGWILGILLELSLKSEKK